MNELKRLLVFTLVACVALMVLFLSLPAGGREGQEVAATAAVQENENGDSLPADLKQMIAFKTSAGGDLKIYLMGDDSVLVSFLEPADPDRAAALSRIDSSDLIVLYQTLTGRSDVPGDLVRINDIVSASRERQKLQPQSDHQEYPIIYPAPDESDRNVNGHPIVGDNSPHFPYFSNGYWYDHRIIPAQFQLYIVMMIMITIAAG